MKSEISRPISCPQGHQLKLEMVSAGTAVIETQVNKPLLYISFANHLLDVLSRSPEEMTLTCPCCPPNKRYQTNISELNQVWAKHPEITHDEVNSIGYFFLKIIPAKDPEAIQTILNHLAEKGFTL